MSKYKYKREDLYRVIVIFVDDGGVTRGAGPYHNILCDRASSWNQTKRYFKQKYPTATHCNIYGGITGAFKRQEKLD